MNLNIFNEARVFLNSVKKLMAFFSVSKYTMTVDGYTITVERTPRN